MTQSSTHWRFAHATPEGVHWRLKRNCSVTPRQLLAMFASLCAVSLGIAGFFWSVGAPLVLPFAVVEVVALGVALVIYARHATDAERISVCGERVLVEVETGGRCERVEFFRDWVRIDARLTKDSLIEVTGQGRRVAVGRYVRPDLRPVLANELRQVLRG